MRTFARLFGKSPFEPLKTHMKKVGVCVEKLTKILEMVGSGKPVDLEKEVEKLSSLEHEADLTKNDIRNHLPKSIFLPMDRSHFLDILSLQDSIADKTEDIGFLLSFSPLDNFNEFPQKLHQFYLMNAEVFWMAKKIIDDIDELLEASFGGIEAEKVKAWVESAAYKEYEASLMEKKLLKELYSKGTVLSPPAFSFWLKLIEEMRGISNLSEKLANRIRMVLELK